MREGGAEAVSFPRPISSTLHGVTDYTVGATLLTVFPKLTGIEGTEAAKQVRVSGAVHAGYSTLTKYELGIVKVIPYKVHLALDLVGALAIGAAPFVTGQWTKGRRHWVPQVGLALFELQSLLFTDPSARGDFHGDVEAVRRVNMEDPGRKIREGGPAVRPAVA